MPSFVIAALLAALVATHAAPADELAGRVDGTWTLTGLEVRHADGRWQALPAPSIGMLIYGIVGPMSARQRGVDAVDAPPASAPPAPVERAVMTLDDGRTRLLWIKVSAP